MFRIKASPAAAVLVAAALVLTACGRSETASSTSESAAASSTVASGPATGTLNIWAQADEGAACPPSPRNSRPPTRASRSMSPRSPGTPRTTSTRPRSRRHHPGRRRWARPGWASSPTAPRPDPDSIDTSAFFPGAMKTTKVGGTSYGVPWYVETRLVYYRKDLAEKAGFTTPPTDWDGLKTMAKAMQTKAGAKWGINLQAGGTGSWQTVMPFAWSNGADLSTPTTRPTCTLDTPQMRGAEVLPELLHRRDRRNRARAPHRRAGTSSAAGRRCSSPGRGRWRRSTRSAAPASRTSTPSRRCRRRKTATSFVGGSNFAVFKDSKNRDAAWKLVSCSATRDAGAVVPDCRPTCPPCKSPGRTRLSGDKKLSVFGTQLKDAKAPPVVRHLGAGRAAVDTEMEKVTKTGDDPAAAHEESQARGHLDRHRRRDDDADRHDGAAGRHRPRRAVGTARARLRERRRAHRLDVRAAVHRSLRRLHRRARCSSLFMSFTDLPARDLQTPFAVNLVGLDNYTTPFATRASAGRRSTRHTSSSSACR